MVQLDGSSTKLKTVQNIARDSQGRIRNELSQLMPSSSTKQPEIIAIHLYDPGTRISTMIYPLRRTFATMTVNQPLPTVPPAFIAATTGNGLPQNDFAKEEDLGTHEIKGLAMHGVRQTQTIASGDTGKEVTVIDEYWYSEDLRINLIVKHSDPRKGTVTMTVGQIARSEPEPRLFQIPGVHPACSSTGENAVSSLLSFFCCFPEVAECGWRLYKARASIGSPI